MSDHLSSLISLAQHAEQSLRRLVFLPVFHDFGQVLQQLSCVPDPATAHSQAATTQANRSLIAHLDAALQRLRSFSEAEQSPQLSRPQWIYKLVFDAMQDCSTTEFPGPLCVPLTRSNIAAVREPKAKYLVCEKSDGLRAIMVSVALPRLPRWYQVDDATNLNESPLRPRLNLRDIALLEAGLGRLLSTAASGAGGGAASAVGRPPNAAAAQQPSRMQLSIGEGTLQLHEYRDDLFWLEPPPDAAVGSNRRKALLRRVADPPEPRYATFFLDRSMTAAFMLLDDVPIPTDLAVVVADGELLLPAPQQPPVSPKPGSNSLIFTTFDFYSFATKQQQQQQQRELSDDGSGSNSGTAVAVAAAAGGSSRQALLEFHHLKDATMSARYEQLQGRLIAPLQRRVQDTAASRRYALAIRFVRKEMLPVAELPALLRRLSRVGGGGPAATVLFDGVTPNDGLIFTPDAFPLIAGSRMDQFKWKWAESLSVDWVVKPLSGRAAFSPDLPRPVWADSGAPLAENTNQEQQQQQQQDPRSTLMYCELFWFFRRRAARYRPGEQDVFGHAFAGHGWLYNPDRLPIEPQYLRSVSGVHSGPQQQQQQQHRGPVAAAQQRDVASEGGTVVECSLVPLSPGACRAHFGVDKSFVGVWRVERVRRDKNCANATTSVLSVVESVSENLDIVELLRELAPSAAADPRAVLHESFFQAQSAAGSRSRAVDLVLPGASAAPHLAAAANAPLPRHPVSQAYFLICVVPENDLKLLRLQWRIKLATKFLVCNHRDASDCVASYDPEHGEAADPAAAGIGASAALKTITGNRLEGILTLALANDGGCIGWSETCVRAHYDPVRGRWVIEAVLPEETQVRDNAYCNQILKHLLFVIGTQTFAAASSSDVAPVVRFVHPTVPLRDTSSARGTSRHYDEIAAFFANRAADGGDGYVKGRGHTERSSLRKHNNWIKQVLLSRALEERGLGLAPSGDKVKATLLDLCSGRGGDLHKYAHSPLKFLMMIDASFDSAVEAARRYCNIDGLSLRTRNRGTDPGVRATFAVADCFDDTIITDIVRGQAARYPVVFGIGGVGSSNSAGGDAAASQAPSEVFDLVSCQFSLHYSCSSEQRLRGFLRAVASSLCVGGVFFGTTVDDRELELRRRAAPDGRSFGNECYRVEFVSEEQARRMTFDDAVRTGSAPLLSEGYLMHMDECVQGALEYVVPFDQLVGIAIEEGLIVVEEANFKDFFEAHRDSPVGRSAFASARLGGNRRGRLGGDDAVAAAAAGKKSEDIDEDAGAGGAADAVPLVVDFKLTEAERTAAYLYRTILLRKFR